MRFFNFFLVYMVQKYQNEIAPIFYYGKSPKTDEKDLKIPNIWSPDWGQPYWMTRYDCIIHFGGSTTLDIHFNRQNSIFHRDQGGTSRILYLSSRPSNLHSYAWDTYFFHRYIAWSYLHRFYYGNCAVLDEAPWFNGFVHLLRYCPWSKTIIFVVCYLFVCCLEVKLKKCLLNAY